MCVVCVSRGGTGHVSGTLWSGVTWAGQPPPRQSCRACMQRLRRACRLQGVLLLHALYVSTDQSQHKLLHEACGSSFRLAYWSPELVPTKATLEIPQESPRRTGVCGSSLSQHVIPICSRRLSSPVSVMAEFGSSHSYSGPASIISCTGCSRSCSRTTPPGRGAWCRSERRLRHTPAVQERTQASNGRIEGQGVRSGTVVYRYVSNLAEGKSWCSCTHACMHAR